MKTKKGNLDEIVKTMLAETISGKKNKPHLWVQNKYFAAAVHEANEAYRYWKWVDRDDEKLNKRFLEIQEQLAKQIYEGY